MTASSAPTSPESSDPNALIDHLLQRYHEVHRQQLPELIAMAHRVETVHHGKRHTPMGLSAALQAMHQELLAHMHKEEAVLFPLLRAGGNSFVPQPIRMMRMEHEQHEQALAQLEQLTGAMSPPADACNTWRALYAGLAEFRDDLRQHIHLENTVLFPQFEPHPA